MLKLEAGKEQAVAATKTYVNSLGAVALLFATSTADAQALGELQRMPEQLAAQLDRSWEHVTEIDRLGGVDGGTVVSRGDQLLHRVRDRAEDPRALRTALRGVLGRRPDARARRGDRRGLARLRGRAVGARARARWPRPSLRSRRAARGLIVISDDDDLRAQAEIGLPLLPGVPEWLSPLVAVVPGQLAALRLAQLRGIDLDAPLGLSKVTLTR